jgi:hypothetical protein
MREHQTDTPAVSSPLPMLPRIVSVEADPETRTILATFETGERRRYDVGPLLRQGVFRRLEEAEAFVAVSVDDMGGVVWEAGPDLSRDTVYLAGEAA